MSKKTETSLILGIETSGNVGGVALQKGEGLLDQISFRKGMIHGVALLPAIERLLRKHEIRPRDIDAVAVSAGPGSYTGVRVGATCAKAFCYATGMKLVAVATLDVMVENVPKKHDVACPVIDARRGDVYACIYRRQDGRWRRTGEVTAEKPDRVARKLPPGAYVLGNGLARYAAIFEERGFTVGAERNWWGRARNVAKLGAALFREGRFEDPFTFIPTYLRPTEADLVQMKSKSKRGQTPFVVKGAPGRKK